jgi:hypothetical protein
VVLIAMKMLRKEQQAPNVECLPPISVAESSENEIMDNYGALHGGESVERSNASGHRALPPHTRAKQSPAPFA